MPLHSQAGGEVPAGRKAANRHLLYSGHPGYLSAAHRRNRLGELPQRPPTQRWILHAVMQNKGVVSGLIKGAGRPVRALP